MKASNASSAATLVSAVQISCNARLAFGCWLFCNLASTLAVLCTQQRWNLSTFARGNCQDRLLYCHHQNMALMDFGHLSPLKSFSDTIRTFPILWVHCLARTVHQPLAGSSTRRIWHCNISTP